MRFFAPEGLAALLAVFGCAGGGAARQDLDALRAEVRALRRDSEDLARRMDMLASQMDVLSARAAGAPRGEETKPSGPEQEAQAAPVIPPDLAVVHMSPPPIVLRAPEPAAIRSPRRPRIAPPVPTDVPIAEPDPARIEQIGERSSGREIVAEAAGELAAARRKSGVDRAHALEDFVERYPRHPSADNVLVEAAASYANVGRAEAACELARRAANDYPAGDAMSDAIERLAWCEARRGSVDAERRMLERLVSDFPRTPAAERAGTRLAEISGRAGGTPEVSPRSGP